MGSGYPGPPPAHGPAAAFTCIPGQVEQSGCTGRAGVVGSAG